MKLNILKFAHLARPRTHEGAPAVAITPEQALRRSVLACMLWENEFYESGVAIAGRIRELVPKVEAGTRCCAGGRGTHLDEAASRSSAAGA